MKKFIIEEEFWSLFPEAKIGIIVCHGINNNIEEEDKYVNMISEAQKEATKYLPNSEFSSNEVVKVWRDAYKKFKTKKGARSSIEAMLKRAANGNGVGAINPLVDIYNAASLKYALPCGGEDIDTFDGDVKLTRATGDEKFRTFGSDENQPPYEGEVIYKDNSGAICRCWNWRESTRTMLTEKTKDAFLVIESIDENRVKDFEEALQFLSKEVKENLGGTSEIVILDINNKEMEIR